MPSTSESARLADQLERAYRGGAWHGPALLEALAGVDATAARLRRIPEAHNIWEIVEHLSAWTEICRQRIVGRTDGDPPPPDDWRPAPTDGPEAKVAWREVLATLEGRHRRLHATILALDDARLDDPVPGADPTVRGLVLGVLQHNAYHGGQITLLRLGGGGAS